MDIYMAAGIGVLLWTGLDLMRDETDTVLLLEWWWTWFDISRASAPLLYWGLILAQAGLGVALVFKGLTS